MGIGVPHGYTIHGTTERDVIYKGNTIRQRFVKVRNPWMNHKVRLYEKDTLRPYMATKKSEDGSDYEAKGTFLMELRDFCTTFNQYYIADDK